MYGVVVSRLRKEGHNQQRDGYDVWQRHTENAVAEMDDLSK